MKIKPEHYDHMKAAIAARFTVANIVHLSERYAYAGLSPTQLPWDLAHSAGLTVFLCKHVYGYANDSHIDTALRRIVAELKESAQ